MSTLLERVGDTVERSGLLPPGARVLVAVSGGSDSVALLHLLVTLAPTCGFVVAGVAHLNHQLRGADSDADEAFCRTLAEQLGLPAVVERIDVGSQARAHRVSMEVAARRARYRFLERAAERVDADTIATGHTRDDQAETFLLRLLRGAGATGLAAIPPRRGLVVRPILGERRAELRAFLAERGSSFREDATNADTAIPRNWVRHVLLPRLGAHLGGDVTDLLARESALLRDDGVLLDEIADETARRVLRETRPGTIVVASADLEALPPALARRVVRRALARVSPAFQGAVHVERVLALAEGREGSRFDLPGARVERNGENVVLYTREGRGFRPAVAFRHGLPVPGRVPIPEAERVIESENLPVEVAQIIQDKQVIGEGAGVVDAGVAADGLWVRSRKPGDTFRPLGLGRRRKLQDVFIDRKVPRDRRDAVPLVVDARDRIVWVAGLGPSDDARVTPATQSVVTLRVSRMGDLG